MVSNLVKISGSPIVIAELGLTISQPPIKEIAVIGEDHFMQATSLLSISAEEYRLKALEGVPEEERQEKEFELMLIAQDDFSLFCQIIQEDANNGYYINVLHSFFLLIFKNFKNLEIDNGLDKSLTLNFNGSRPVIIDKHNFNEIRDILVDLFSFDEEEQDDEFNPVGDAAAEIVEKIKAAREKRKVMRGDKDIVITTVIGTMAMNLSLSSGIPLQEVFEMTLPQLILMESRANKKDQRELENLIGSIHGFKDLELTEYGTPL